MFGETCTLVNRTKGRLVVTFDGQQIDIEPGENHRFPLIAVPFAKKQNIVMGSEDPYNPMKYESLVGVLGTKDPVTPIKQSKAVERLDRSKVRGIGRKAKHQEGEHMSPFEARIGGAETEIDGDAASRS